MDYISFQFYMHLEIKEKDTEKINSRFWSDCTLSGHNMSVISLKFKYIWSKKTINRLEFKEKETLL